MTLTNIHHDEQVLTAAGRDMSIQAVIAYLNRGVFLVGRAFAQEELDALAAYLQSPVREMWIQDESYPGTKVVPVEGNIPIPTLYTSPGLEQTRAMRLTDEEAKSKNLAYIILARGRSGALYNKVRIFYSRRAVCAGILEEALQGCSVVFSAVMLKKDVSRLPDKSLTLVKVEKLGSLLEMAEQEGHSRIPLCC